MKKLFIFLFLGFGNTLFAQSNKTSNNFDLSIGVGSGVTSPSLAWTHNHGLGKKKNFKIGYGVRFNTFSGKNLDYSTAPANLTAKPETIDTFRVVSAKHNSITALINLQYSFGKKLDVGFNIDVVGLDFGKTITGTYISAGKSTQQSAAPTKNNLLLMGDNDRGLVNSEFYLKYWINSKMAIKAGASYIFTEYTTQNKLASNNDRFRNKSMIGLIGISFSPSK